MGETDWGGNWVLFWWAGPCSVNLWSNFLLMGGGLCSLPVIYLGPNYGRGNEDNGDLLQKVPCMYCSNPAACHCQPIPLLETPGHSQASLVQSREVTDPFSWVWHPQVSFCALQESVSPVLCKFWWLSCRVNGDPLQEGLCHTQVCCTQSPCPCGRPLLTCTSTGDTQTQFCLSLSGVSESWCVQGLFEPSEHLWQVWGLILNVISPLLPWGFASALGHGLPFFGGIQHYFVNGCSAVSCNFLVPAGKDEDISFYSAIYKKQPRKPDC